MPTRRLIEQSELSYKEEKVINQSLESRFNTFNVDVRRGMKLCFLSLAILVPPEFLSDDNDDTENNDGKYDIISIDLIRIFWCELFGINEMNGRRDLTMSSHSEEGIWSKYFSPTEKKAFFKFIMSNGSQIDRKTRLKKISRMNAFNRGCTLKFLHIILQNLIDIGVVKFASFRINEKKVIEDEEDIFDDVKSERFLNLSMKTNSYEVYFIALDRTSCDEYGNYLADLPMEQGGFSTHEYLRLFHRLNKFMTDACIKSHSEMLKNKSSEIDDSALYALDMLPLHLMRAEQGTDKAFQLLNCKKFFQQRIKAMGVVNGARRHLEDCSNLQYQLFDEKSENAGHALGLPLTLMKTCLKELVGKKSLSEIGLAFNELAFQAEKIGWVEGALDFFAESIKLRKENEGGDNAELGETLYQMGNTYINNSLYHEGLRCLEEAIVIEKRHLGNVAVQVARTLTSIALVHSLMQDHEKALTCYKELLAMKEIMFGENSMETAKIFNSIGLMHQNLKFYDKALLCYSKAARVTKLNTMDKVFLSEIYCNLGSTHCDSGDLDKSIQSYNEAIKFGNGEVKNYSAVTRAHHKKGKAHAEREEFKQAISCYEKALLMATSYLSGNIGFRIQILQDFAQAYYETQQYSNAIKKLNLVTDVLQYSYGENHDILYKTYQNIAKCYESLGRISKAVLNYKLVLDYEKKRSDKSSLDIANLLQHIGDLCALNQTNHTAMTYFKEACQIREKELGPSHIDVAATKHRMGVILIKENDSSRALTYFTDALQIRKEKLGEDNELVADTVHNMALAHKSCEEYDLALECYNRALTIRTVRLGKMHGKVAETLYNIGIVQVNLGKDSEAISTFEDAFKIYLSLGFATSDRNVENIVHWISFLKEKRETGELAKECVNEKQYSVAA